MVRGLLTIETRPEPVLEWRQMPARGTGTVDHEERPRGLTEDERFGEKCVTMVIGARFSARRAGAG